VNREHEMLFGHSLLRFLCFLLFLFLSTRRSAKVLRTFQSWCCLVFEYFVCFVVPFFSCQGLRDHLILKELIHGEF